jgi:hypothetical protein
MTDVDRCLYPVKEHHQRFTCGRAVVAVYIAADGKWLPRCATHDGPVTQAYARSKGIARVTVEELAGVPA